MTTSEPNKLKELLREGFLTQREFKAALELSSADHVAQELEARERWETRECPLCAERIKRKAVRCKHCHGEVNDSAQSLQEMQDAEEKAAQWGCKPWEVAERETERAKLCEEYGRSIEGLDAVLKDKEEEEAAKQELARKAIKESNQKREAQKAREQMEADRWRLEEEDRHRHKQLRAPSRFFQLSSTIALVAGSPLVFIAFLEGFVTDFLYPTVGDEMPAVLAVLGAVALVFAALVLPFATWRLRRIDAAWGPLGSKSASGSAAATERGATGPTEGDEAIERLGLG